MQQDREPTWDYALLAELARAFNVDERTIRRNVRHLVASLGPSLLGSTERLPCMATGACPHATCHGRCGDASRGTAPPASG